MPEEKIRLQKFLSEAGVCSRRQGEAFMKNGKVTVNGKICTELGTRVNPITDYIEFCGSPVKLVSKHVTIMLNKPRHVLTTMQDNFGRQTVIDLLKDDNLPRIYPVGRLDYDTEGLLLLTNNGALTHKLTHPRHQIDKLYIATIRGIISPDKLIPFFHGMEIDGYQLAPAQAEIIETKHNLSKVKVVIHEGRNRQVRKMFQGIGYPVVGLKRLQIGNIALGALPLGKWRYLTKQEITYLEKL